MITQKIDANEEFYNPNLNYEVLMKKMQKRIETLELDITQIKDTAVKAFAEKELMALRQTYFDYLKTDLELQHLVLSNPEIYGGNKEVEKDEII